MEQWTTKVLIHSWKQWQIEDIYPGEVQEENGYTGVFNYVCKISFQLQTIYLF